MSTEAMEAVLANSKSKGGPRGVLLALAWKTFDTKPPFTGPFTPAYIARLANVTPRQAVTSIERLVRIGELKVNGKLGRAYTYAIDVPLAANYEDSFIPNYEDSFIDDKTNYEDSFIPNYEDSFQRTMKESSFGSDLINNINNNKQKASPDRLSADTWQRLLQRIRQREPEHELSMTMYGRLRSARLELYRDEGRALVICKANPDNYDRDFGDYIRKHLRPVTQQGWYVEIYSEDEIKRAAHQEASEYAKLQ